ncbi:hypothetical protein SAMN02745216_00168 [Desulfatibacillum alkenivorans DSM 16219]|jgi:hypothetical protein|uniref:Outer membrane lipoprotein-sorting protein n=1 Tax=Desulfatibacillum alkenivorans DSM 16219 TaxID=1121393 RepID=A0A1M6C796_9BACT|nr:hypothetical protein [Desulfatibacillum alkenivorans]SHI56813.1 hypothetical protein SAMN02745216_00168 [Desulfatibacillum alkenivorans DSM 16219]
MLDHTLKKLAACVLIAGLLFAMPAASIAADDGDSGVQTLQSMISDLEKAIESADKRMIAHPSFLDELRGLVEAYKAKIRTVFFSDDFSDGNYKLSPRWTVDSGFFLVTPGKRLRSQVNEKKAAAKQGGSSNQGEEVFNILLKGMLDAATNDQGSQQGAATQSVKEYETPAVIRTACSIPAAFEADVSFAAEPSQGAMEMVLMGGSPARALYRLVYNASPSADRPIQIIREKGGRSYVIDMAGEYPMLEDGRLHRIQWSRDMNGNMLVMVDGKTLIRTVELFYRDSFTGFALANQGGIWEWDSVRILQPMPGQ